MMFNIILDVKEIERQILIAYQSDIMVDFKTEGRM